MNAKLPTAELVEQPAITPIEARAPVWVVSASPDDDPLGRIGDARELADSLKTSVEAIVVGDFAPDRTTIEAWIHGGADRVRIARLSRQSQAAAVAALVQISLERRPRVVYTLAHGEGKAIAARFAAQTDWPLVAPVMLVRSRHGRLSAVRLDNGGRRARSVDLRTDVPTIVGFPPSVAQAAPPDPTRTGEIIEATIVVDGESPRGASERLAPDPATADIRDLPKLIAGGKGVGGRDGFHLLRRVADCLGAGVAASRMAVDLGWIEPDRQVGQTGKTVRPDLYIACGVSGASHHLEGMSDARHVVAINTDPDAPLMQRAALALQADLHATLAELARMLEARG